MRLRKLLTFFSMVVIVIAFISQRCYAIRVEQSSVNDANGNVLYATTRSYNEGNKVTEVKTVDLENKVLVDYTYRYNKSGNVISEKDSVNGNYREFSFDSSNQLVAEKYFDTSGKLTKEISYQYDQKGNRTQKIVSHDNTLETTGYEYNKQNQITEVNNNQDYKYDENNNLVQDGKKTNTFNTKGELIQVKQGNKVIESYQYNDEGVRIKKEFAGETEVYNYNDDGQLSSIADATGKQKISFTRDANGNLVSMSDNENMYWYLFDGLWNVKGLADKDGTKVVSYEYDAFGNCIKSEGKSANPFMFMGYQFDTRTGYYYLGSRYYSPDTGRFISADGYTEDALAKSNLYKYANNNPLRYKDSYGHWVESIDSKLPEWAQDEIRSLTAEWSNATTDEAKDRIHAKANCIRAYAEKQNPTTLKGISAAFTVKDGSSGDDVRSLQQALKDAERTITVDGQFGSKTYVALCQYQVSNSLLKDGVAGINTWAELGEVYYGENYSKLDQGYFDDDDVISNGYNYDYIQSVALGIVSSVVENGADSIRMTNAILMHACTLMGLPQSIADKVNINFADRKENVLAQIQSYVPNPQGYYVGRTVADAGLIATGVAGVKVGVELIVAGLVGEIGSAVVEGLSLGTGTPVVAVSAVASTTAIVIGEAVTVGSAILAINATKSIGGDVSKLKNSSSLKSNSLKLRDNMKKAGMQEPSYKPNVAHHIVPAIANKAERARQILRECGITDIDCAENGVFLPGKKGIAEAGNASVHLSRHLNSYIDEVTLRLQRKLPAIRSIENKQEAIEVLDGIRQDLLSGRLKLQN